MGHRTQRQLPLCHLIRDRTIAPESRSGLVFQNEEFTVTCAPLKHRVTENDRAGKFDIHKARALNTPEGKNYGLLKQGKTITLEDGRTFVGKPQKGRSIVYCDSAVELAKGADVLIHEATFAHQDADMAFQRLHSTSTMAAQTALGAGVRQLIMTHFSPRYTLQMEELLAEARAIFPQTILAYDFLVVDVPLPETEETVQN